MKGYIEVNEDNGNVLMIPVSRILYIKNRSHDAGKWECVIYLGRKRDTMPGLALKDTYEEVKAKIVAAS